MRTFRFTFYAERNDECVDLEKVIEADNIMNALLIFQQGRTLYKRIIEIKEI